MPGHNVLCKTIWKPEYAVCDIARNDTVNWKEQIIFLALAHTALVLPEYWFPLLLLEGLLHGRQGQEEILSKM